MLEVVAALREAGGAEAAGWSRSSPRARTGEIDRSFLDVGRARAELGFTTATTLGDGMRRTVDALREARAQQV